MADPSGNVTDKPNRAFYGRAGLIVGASDPLALRLASRLAENGLDVAVVYLDNEDSNPAIDNTTRQMKEAIEAHGQQCLIIHGQGDSSESPQHIVDLVISRFGRLDLYFDFSQASERPAAVSSNGDDHVSALLPQLSLMAAVLSELVDS
jgi:NAD(P)-dependent dehydrogenase (short-subunit alcohol dehydrogenase family)